MYTDALSFLEDERDAWRPYEALSQLSDAELDAIEAFVNHGGGLVVLGETEQEKYGNTRQRAAGPLRAAPRERHGPGL